MTFVKFCGMTREADVAAACELGVQALGFVLWPKSPRFVPVARAAALVKQLPEDVVPVGVFVDPSADDLSSASEAGIQIMQIHGSTVPAAVPHTLWRASSVDGDAASVPEGMMVLLDVQDPERHGGTGRTIDWSRAAAIAATRRVMLAGGLTPANVRAAIRCVRPFGVDVASGIEDRPGIKDAQAMRAFVAAVREADQ
jgi:phosphoribosylanthranilate isomerase